jgi:hypothetical protein
MGAEGRMDDHAGQDLHLAVDDLGERLVGFWQILSR